jgi:hypothetical protein
MFLRYGIQGRIVPIFLGQQWVGHRPIDTQSRIVPPQTVFVLCDIEVRAFIEEVSRL